MLARFMFSIIFPKYGEEIRRWEKLQRGRLPNHQMLYNICFIPKTKRTYSYKQYHENNILSILETLQYKLIYVTTL